MNAKYANTSDEMVALMANGGGGQYDMVSSSGDADLRIIYAGDAHPVNINLIPELEELLPAVPVARRSTPSTACTTASRCSGARTC